MIIFIEASPVREGSRLKVVRDIDTGGITRVAESRIRMVTEVVEEKLRLTLKLVVGCFVLTFDVGLALLTASFDDVLDGTPWKEEEEDDDGGRIIHDGGDRSRGIRNEEVTGRWREVMGRIKESWGENGPGVPFDAVDGFRVTGVPLLLVSRCRPGEVLFGEVDVGNDGISGINDLGEEDIDRPDIDVLAEPEAEGETCRDEGVPGRFRDDKREVRYKADRRGDLEWQ